MGQGHEPRPLRPGLIARPEAHVQEGPSPFYTRACSTGGHVLYSTLLGVAGILLAAGLIELRRAPLAASIAIAAGAILGGVMTFYLILTLAAALLVLVWLLLGSRKRRSPATA